MRKNNLLLMAAFFAFTAFWACHKHENEDDTKAPVLTIMGPSNGASVSGTVRIYGTVEDESLHEMEIILTRDSDSAVLFTASPTVHDKTSYSFDESFSPAGIATETDVTLSISVADHSDHTTSQTVKFKIKS